LSAEDSARPRLPAGRVGRPHGLDGSFYVTRATARLLSSGTAVTVGSATREIVRRAGTDERPIVRLDGVEDRAAAEALRGQQLTVAAAAAPALEDGEWWAHELEGCAVVDGEHRLGTVARLIEMPSCELLEVTREQGEPLLVPMIRDAIRSVRPDRSLIDVDSEFLGLGDG
jgi:16S rRNA processing protein RimM